MLCDRGDYQPDDDYLGEACLDCQVGKFQGDEGGTACIACDRPLCSGMVGECDDITGELGSYTFMTAEQAASTICDPEHFGAWANSTYVFVPADACDAPEYCRTDALQCNTEPNRYELTLDEPPCPSMLGAIARMQGNNASCWDQIDGTLHFSPTTNIVTRFDPPISSCGSNQVVPRVQVTSAARFAHFRHPAPPCPTSTSHAPLPRAAHRATSPVPLAHAPRRCSTSCARSTLSAATR